MSGAREPVVGRVLLVDDSEIFVEFLRAELAGAGWQVDVAYDGAAGVAAAQSCNPEVVICDLNMPEMDGFGVLAQLSTNAALPVIVHSTENDLGAVLRAVRSGAFDYVLKAGEDFRPLLAAAERALGHARVVRENQRLTDELRRAHEELTRKDQLITEDLLQARLFQQTMLPSLPEVSGFAVGAVYRPAGLVGGDLFDVHRLPDGQLRLFLADVTGHGVQACLRTMIIKSEYDRTKLESLTPAGVLRHLDSRMTSVYSSQSICFAASCLDFASGAQGATLRYANGGLPQLLRVAGGEVHGIHRPGSFLGLHGGLDFEELEVELRAGDRVFAFTDGVYGEQDAGGEVFGPRRMVALLKAVRGPVSEAAEQIVKELEAFLGGAPPTDDLTLLGVEVRS